MANTNCEACEELRQTDPSLIVNGLGDEECASLQNDTGLVASSGNNDCEDLHNLNDCLVGNYATEVDAYDVCDWKTFMKKFIPNLWTTLKAIICAICGIWTNIHSLWTNIQNLWERLNQVWCWIEHLVRPQSNDTLTPDDPRVRYRAARGVQSRYDPAHPKPSDAPLRIQVIGSVARITGSIHCETTDSEGSNAKYMPSSYTGSGTALRWNEFDKDKSVTNQYGRNSHDGNCPTGGFLLYEYEVKACDWGFSVGYDAPLHPSNAGEFLCRIYFFNDGEEYPYDCGWDANGKGQIYHPSSSAYDTLIQVRLMYMDTWGIAYKNGNITPNGLAMVRPCTSAFSC